MAKEVRRYSDEELAEFKKVVEERMQRVQEEIDYLQEQINELNERMEGEATGDFVDSGTAFTELQLLYTQLGRQRQYMRELENAMVRIRNKTYGICTVTGELIDKKRLLAVPTATKSLIAKEAEKSGKLEELRRKAHEAPDVPATDTDDEGNEKEKPKAEKPKPQPKVITKIIRKPKNPPKPVEPILDDEDEDDLELELDDIDTLLPLDDATDVADEEGEVLGDDED